MRLRIPFLMGIMVLLGCGGKKENKVSFDEAGYKAEIEHWHKSRIDYLKSENGWLNLAGLFWLKEGVNTFGSDESNDLVFP